MAPNLETSWLGLKLKHPVVASSGPFTHDLDGFRQLEDGGVSAIVMHSLFEEQVQAESHLVDHFADYGAESYGEALSYVPDLDDYNTGPDGYLDLISRAKASLDVPVIASLNGASPGGWGDYARSIEKAGASALELNIYHLAADPNVSGSEVEQQYLDVVAEVRAGISIPLAVKVGPFFSAPAHMARQLSEAGADGLVLFNRFYQPDFDLEKLEVAPHLELSDPFEMRLPMRWVAILFGRVKTDFAITSGVHASQDVIKGIMAGANATMMTSELLQRGPHRVGEIVTEMSEWLMENEYESVKQMRGSMSQQRIDEPAHFERANYMKTLQSWRPDPALGHEHGT